MTKGRHLARAPGVGGLSAFVDARTGATGDMWLGAVVGAGASLERIEQAVATLGIGNVRVSYGRVRRGGRDAVSVRVRPPQQTPRVGTLGEVRALLSFAALEDGVRDRALSIFDTMAQAVTRGQEAPADDLHFPEAAMLDDLAVIVGTSVGLDDLGVTRLMAGPVGVSSTADDSDAGRTVLALLARHEKREIDIDAAIVTPVGAAIIAALAEPVDEPPHLLITASGVGAAQRDLAGAGLLHLTIGVAAEEQDGQVEKA